MNTHIFPRKLASSLLSILSIVDLRPKFTTRTDLIAAEVLNHL